MQDFWNKTKIFIFYEGVNETRGRNRVENGLRYNGG